MNACPELSLRAMLKMYLKLKPAVVADCLCCIRLHSARNVICLFVTTSSTQIKALE